MVEAEDGDGGGGHQVFSGVHYRLIGFDERLDLETKYKSAIDRRAGKLAVRLEKATHFIIYSEKINYDDNFCVMARRNNITVVNEFWVDDSISYGALSDTKKVMYCPVKELAGISGSLQLHIYVDEYPLDKKNEIQRMIHLIGATFCDEWNEKATHLICNESKGPLYNLAKQRKANIVNHKWLEDCLKEWKIVSVAPYSTISGSELELVHSQSKGENNQFKAKPPGRQQYHTPQIKLSSMDTSRKAFSVGAKRSNINMDNENTVNCKKALQYQPQIKLYSKDTSRSTMKCKRALNFGSASCSTGITMHEYAKCGLTKEIKIPYMQPKRKMGKDSAKQILLDAYGLIVDLHSEDKTLRGLFSSKNFLISPRRNQVSLHDIEPQEYNEGDDKIDKSRFVVMVKGLFDNDPPVDILVWIDCIEDEGHDNVVRKHINMLHPNVIFGEFCVMYHCLIELKDYAEGEFRTLLKKLYTYDHWRTCNFEWFILENNRRRQGQSGESKTQDHHEGDPDADEKKKHFKTSAFGPMQELRNCWEHPARRYKQFLLPALLGDFPSLLSDVQRELHSGGYLPHLDVENMD